MADASTPEELVTLARVGDLTAAQLFRGRLEAEGIACHLPDEPLAKRRWHGSVGSMRVQVRSADLERARQVLAEPGVGDTALAAAADPQGGSPAAPGGGDDLSISAGDRAAFRSLRVALASLWLMGFLHPYSLWLALRALRRDDITAWGQRRAGIALLVSLAGCAWAALLAYHLARLGHSG